MFKNLDQLKLQIRELVIKYRKQLNQQCPYEEQQAFEVWFWKMVPLIQVDLTLYNSSIRVYDPPPNPDEKLKVTSG